MVFKGLHVVTLMKYIEILFFCYWTLTRTLQHDPAGLFTIANRQIDNAFT